MHRLKRLFSILFIFSLILTSMSTISYGNSSSQLDSVFKVQYLDGYGMGATATAWVIENNDTQYLLTNNHFCADYLQNGELGFFTYENDKNSGESHYVASDSDRDLCLLEIDDHDLKSFKLAKVKAQPLDQVTIIGYPRGIGPIYLKSFVSGLWPDPALANIDEGLWISELIYPGSSGSPVLNKRGNVVGIIYAGPRGTYGALAIPTSEIKKFLEEYNE